MPDWPHSPLHRLSEHGAYMITAGTMRKQHFFNSVSRLARLHDCLLDLAARYEWNLQAWAVFSNHYHFIAVSPAEPQTLRCFIRHLHSTTAVEFNQLDMRLGEKCGFSTGIRI